MAVLAPLLAVPEIAASVEVVLGLLRKLPPSDYDCGLTLPLFVCGCMTDNVLFRENIKQRLQLIDDQTGRVPHTRTLMEAVWYRRATAVQSQPHSPFGGLDWRDSLRDQLGNLLLL